MVEENQNELEETQENPQDADLEESQKSDFTPPQTKEELEEIIKSRTGRLYARAKSAEEQLKKREAELAELKKSLETKTAPMSQMPKDDSLLDAKTYARLLFKGYSEEEIDIAEAIAKGSKKTIDEVLSDKFFQAGIQALREEKRSQQATPPPSRGKIEIGGKTWEQMTEKERKEYYQKILREEAKGRSNKI